MRFTHFLAISLCGIANVACQMDEIEVPREELFTRAFIKEFGIPDPDQDWNVATRVTANVDPNLVRGAETISVYDCMPGGPDCQLAARFSASTTSFDFDFAKGNTSAYVQATDANGSVILSGRFPINDGILTVAKRTSRADEETCNIKPICIDDTPYANGIGRFNFNKFENNISHSCNFEFWNKVYQYNIQSANTTDDILNRFDLYALSESDNLNLRPYNGNTGGYEESNFVKAKFDDNSNIVSCSDLAPIVGKDGVFSEGLKNGDCNLNKHKSKLDISNGVIYSTKDNASSVELEYLYGCGIYHNALGYFYYPEGASYKDIIEAPKFILMMDASPWKNLQREDLSNAGQYKDFTTEPGYGMNTSGVFEQTPKGWDGNCNYAGMVPAYDIATYEGEVQNSNTGKNIKYKTSKHKLVYYELDNNKPKPETATYKFPAGYNIGFFIIVEGYPKMAYHNSSDYTVPSEDIRYSLPWMNQLFGAPAYSLHNHSFEAQKLDFGNGSISGYAPLMSFCTYKHGNDVYLGVEDGAYQRKQNGGTIDMDHDMNDILFRVTGIEDEDIVEIGDDPKAESWIVACEDLGSFHDFDFNDVVFGLSYFATDKNEDRCLKVKALAAGGTLPVQLMWTDPNGKQHDLGAENGYPRWNNWFKVNNENQVVNCNHNRDYQYDGATVTIDLKEFPDYSISPNSYLNEGEKYPMGGFSIGVYEDGGYKFTREVKPLGQYQEGDETWSKTPQMILLHRTWRWPIENKPIFDAYSGGKVTGSDKYVKQAGFRDWIKDKYNIEWTSIPSDTEVVVEHNWNGEKFTSGNKQ